LKNASRFSPRIFDSEAQIECTVGILAQMPT